jgi:ZIP family zinc transporter
MSPGEGFVKAFPAAIGFACGALFLFALDKFLPHLHINFPQEKTEGVQTKWNKTILLVLAITLHNIPEGLAVGVLFGGVAAGIPEASIGGAYKISRKALPFHFPFAEWGCHVKKVFGMVNSAQL